MDMWEEWYLELSFRARAWRMASGISRETMARYLQCDAKTVQRFENGERPGIAAKVVFGYSAYFLESVDSFFKVRRGRGPEGEPIWWLEPLAANELRQLPPRLRAKARLRAERDAMARRVKKFG